MAFAGAFAAEDGGAGPDLVGGGDGNFDRRAFAVLQGDGRRGGVADERSGERGGVRELGIGAALVVERQREGGRVAAGEEARGVGLHDKLGRDLDVGRGGAAGGGRPGDGGDAHVAGELGQVERADAVLAHDAREGGREAQRLEAPRGDGADAAHEPAIARAVVAADLGVVRLERVFRDGHEHPEEVVEARGGGADGGEEGVGVGPRLLREDVDRLVRGEDCGVAGCARFHAADGDGGRDARAALDDFDGRRADDFELVLGARDLEDGDSGGAPGRPGGLGVGGMDHAGGRADAGVHRGGDGDLDDGRGVGHHEHARFEDLLALEGEQGGAGERGGDAQARRVARLVGIAVERHVELGGAGEARAHACTAVLRHGERERGRGGAGRIEGDEDVVAAISKNEVEDAVLAVGQLHLAARHGRHDGFVLPHVAAVRFADEAVDVGDGEDLDVEGAGAGQALAVGRDEGDGDGVGLAGDQLGGGGRAQADVEGVAMEVDGGACRDGAAAGLEDRAFDCGLEHARGEQSVHGFEREAAAARVVEAATADDREVVLHRASRIAERIAFPAGGLEGRIGIGHRRFGLEAAGGFAEEVLRLDAEAERLVEGLAFGQRGERNSDLRGDEGFDGHVAGAEDGSRVAGHAEDEAPAAGGLVLGHDDGDGGRERAQGVGHERQRAIDVAVGLDEFERDGEGRGRLGLGVAQQRVRVDRLAMAIDAAVGEDEGRAFVLRHVVGGAAGLLGDGAGAGEGHEHEVGAVRGFGGDDEGLGVGHGVGHDRDAVGA